MPKNATPINLTDEETCYLESLVNKGTIEARVYRRAKILLLKSAGISNEAIAEKLDTTVPTVRLCQKKYADSGVKSALADAAWRGRMHEIFEDSKAWVINIACQKPTAFGLSAELWNPTSLTRYSVVSQNKVPVSCTKTANYYINSIMISLCACL